MKKYLVPTIVLVTIAGASYYLYQKHNPFTYYEDEVHVHADFLIYVNDKKLDLTDVKYQSSAEQILHKNVHLHDDEDNVVHRHAEGITFAEFLSSVGFTLTNDCLTIDTGEAFCDSEETVLTLYVNKEPFTDIATYISQEEDQVLLYYGTKDNPSLNQYLESVTNDSCIYSGTCTERGVAPPESCGLTCEI
jgi:hypothetical protein